MPHFYQVLKCVCKIQTDEVCRCIDKYVLDTQNHFHKNQKQIKITDFAKKKDIE